MDDYEMEKDVGNYMLIGREGRDDSEILTKSVPILKEREKFY